MKEIEISQSGNMISVSAYNIPASETYVGVSNADIIKALTDFLEKHIPEKKVIEVSEEVGNLISNLLPTKVLKYTFIIQINDCLTGYFSENISTQKMVETIFYIIDEIFEQESVILPEVTEQNLKEKIKVTLTEYQKRMIDGRLSIVK